MEDIFEKERDVINEADSLLKTNIFASTTDRERYKKLLDAYKRLLKQMRTMVKMSDIMQSKLNSMSSELEKLSQIDGLTGLYNRRYLNEIYRREWDNAFKTQTPLGALMIDIDFFKKYNDTFGHLAGDVCLQSIAKAIEQTVAGTNAYTGRFGGEEFVVLLPGSDQEKCSGVARKMIDHVALLNIQGAPGSCCGKVSVSIGIGSMIPGENERLDALIHMADQALYRAKEDGRNCFRI